jgi:hypothetical protein
MADIGMAAFATFFMQSPSFLAQQTALARGRGTSNCRTLFQMTRIPSDNHIRAMLDPAPPQHPFPVFSHILAALEAGGGLASFRRLGGHILIARDGTEYFCSQKLSCPHCRPRTRANGKTEHFHPMVSAAMVAPGQPVRTAVGTHVPCVVGLREDKRKSEEAEQAIRSGRVSRGR